MKQNNHNNLIKNNIGYTMLELLFVVAIIIILAQGSSIHVSKIVDRAHRSADISNLKALNLATILYQSLESEDQNCLFDYMNDQDRINALVELQYIDTIPVPKVKGFTFTWDNNIGKWIYIKDQQEASHRITTQDGLQMGLLHKTGVLQGEYSGEFAHIFIPEIFEGEYIRKIDSGVFRQSGLEAVSFSATMELESIGDRAFSGNRMEEIVLPDSLKSIGNQAFFGNPLIRITIGEGVDIGANLIGFQSDFSDAYESEGRKAGTYENRNGRWIRQ